MQTLLLANPTLVASLAALQAALNDLVNLILTIHLNVKIQASPSGAAQAKKDALLALGDAVFEVAGAVLSFAEKAGNATLAARVNYSRSAITAGDTHAVVARGQDIIDAATENLASLSEHGVTAEKLDAFKLTFKTYDVLRVLPRQAKAAGAAATQQLERSFPEARRLLKNRVDRLIWQFRESAPEFYDQYQVARSIVDAPTNSPEETAAAAAPASETKTTPGSKVA